MKPGESHDMNGVPIYPGDLLKSFHFTGARRKRYYLYHVAVMNQAEKRMEMVPVHNLEPTKACRDGMYWLLKEMESDIEVITGYGPGHCLYFDERPKRPKLRKESKS